MMPTSSLSLARKSLHWIVDRSIFSAAAGAARASARAARRAARRNPMNRSFPGGTQGEPTPAGATVRQTCAACAHARTLRKETGVTHRAGLRGRRRLLQAALAAATAFAFGAPARAQQKITQRGARY